MVRRRVSWFWKVLACRAISNSAAVDLGQGRVTRFAGILRSSKKGDLMMETGDIVFLTIVAVAFTVFGLTLAVLSSR